MKFNLKMYILLCFVIAGHLAACVSRPVGTTAPASDVRPTLTGRAYVYDGDSIFVGKVEVRLEAIDAPERDQACRDATGHFWLCGIVARDALRRMVGDGVVECSIKGRDQYRRLLGVCYAHDRDLNAAMVAQGYAVAYHHFSEKYAPQEEEAQARSLGIWQDADFTEPYFCRHFVSGHTCYEYDYAAGTGRAASLPLIGKSREINAAD